jgi:hypothetical protein
MTKNTQQMLDSLSREQLEKESKMLGATLTRLLYSAENFIQTAEGHGLDYELSLRFPDYVALKEQVEQVNSILNQEMG